MKIAFDVVNSWISKGSHVWCFSCYYGREITSAKSTKARKKRYENSQSPSRCSVCFGQGYHTNNRGL